MIPPARQKPVFRFAPSPNGRLHLGHALSALINADMAKAAGGRLLLRMEDIDIGRCTPEFETAIYDDLTWLGLAWEEPVRRQSEHLDEYRAALDQLIARGLAYPAFMTRGEVKARAAQSEEQDRPWPRDPDGAPHYPEDDRFLTDSVRRKRIASGERHGWRLDMESAIASIGTALTWTETGDGETGEIAADPAAWGDVVLWRSDAPSSYHLSVTVDDAAQGVTHVVRGLDLFHATSVHRLLQTLLGLPAPRYHHHRLILGKDGRKLSKSQGDTALAELRKAGRTSEEIRRLLGL
ncbi:tRNA glutamyl-Q(34) synthetase GluQRS [Rhizobium sp. S95]|uniref:tRNA glutamyl-Q(34) synthetase GluQRS n=1 Tax=Ciceribacter sichuanensis TaxID=2949647 RepID=A0AAJ1BWL3_9HYPH|nr:MULTISPECIES: tRNA glutamyl-Q(34) synthetase GluQRS [unclassified Ciceribacter]MCM2396222.1 tRNA glutamyl-Q(34) synthetase GluQRS [Ciceribacter sp. S95]MCO5957627.1 tRNA glutamyl-Q(34) synthetase GluQRS [Ciceribacter sp. S101]